MHVLDDGHEAGAAVRTRTNATAKLNIKTVIIRGLCGQCRPYPKRTQVGQAYVYTW